MKIIVISNRCNGKQWERVKICLVQSLVDDENVMWIESFMSWGK